MFPELGKYGAVVMTAYGATLVLLAWIVVASLWRGARVRRALAAMEARARGAKQEGEPDNG
ncbi:heme exporter protein CcmD [Phaeovulum vinaykumarii]|uniref:Heme exporter protein D n=1 Tax=Phaeovulum vinaykumarii TaxID=407234 RepID=A0A1N7M2V0_9RHOB|nr:heme exporter protein CcmD [Phaeovulum vinaykumarii]SIS80372.1 heme exporter protein D [Phaeovulum vinaykumarii]SOC09255.1 heme exporter protein D [Phaeovulum vinaykumarii]